MLSLEAYTVDMCLLFASDDVTCSAISEPPGVEEVYGLGDLSDYEKSGLQALIPELRSSIEKGEQFAKES